MAQVEELDSVRTTTDIVVEDRTIPAGSQGAVVDVLDTDVCLVEFALREQTEDDPGDFIEAELTTGQYEIVHKHKR